MISRSPRQLSFSRRALLLGAGMGATGAALVGRMAWLSVFDSQRLAEKALANRIQSKLIPPRRGWIVDRAGKPIALNRPDYRVELIPAEAGDIDLLLASVSTLLELGADDLARIRKDIASQPRFMPVVLAAGLDWPLFAEVNVKLAELPGISPVRAFSRHYPDAEHFAHLVGYVGAPTPEQFQKSRDPLLIYPGFRVGKDGIERHEDAALRGRAGAAQVEVTARGRTVRELGTRPDQPGETIHLTIDRDLQSYAARRLGGNSASVIVMDCLTGDILTMVSMPGYDPNVFSQRVPAQLWQALQ